MTIFGKTRDISAFTARFAYNSFNKKISVIIPALNEENTIAGVIRTARLNRNVDEILIIDDMSTDRTAEIAVKLGAKVIQKTVRGKGSSMQIGLNAAKNKIVVYLDADIEEYNKDIIGLLTRPIQKGKADFVKATFDRKAGRVTELVAKPLLGILFPEALKFSQPLSGMIASKKPILEKATFENDYGVDIGILLDVIEIGARAIEVNIGKIDHKMKPWEQLPKMAQEVSRAILKRAGVVTDQFSEQRIRENINAVY